jgi:hypothetical protein
VWQIGQLAANMPPPPWQIYAPVAFDILDAMVEALLQPREDEALVVRREVLTMGSVRYQLGCQELGGLGALRLRKLRAELTELYLERPEASAGREPRGGNAPGAHELRQRLGLQRDVMSGFLGRYHAELRQLDEQVKTGQAKQELPPSPRDAGWGAVFAWFYQWGAPRRMTVDELAAQISYAASTVRHRKAEYDAEHGTSLRKKRQL